MKRVRSKAFESKSAIGRRGEWSYDLLLPATQSSFAEFYRHVHEKALALKGAFPSKGLYYVSVLIATVGRLYETRFAAPADDGDESDLLTYNAFSTGAVANLKDVRIRLRKLLERADLLAGARDHKLVKFRVTRFKPLQTEGSKWAPTSRRS